MRRSFRTIDSSRSLRVTRHRAETTGQRCRDHRPSRSRSGSTLAARRDHRRRARRAPTRPRCTGGTSRRASCVGRLRLRLESCRHRASHPPEQSGRTTRIARRREAFFRSGSVPRLVSSSSSVFSARLPKALSPIARTTPVPPNVVRAIPLVRQVEGSPVGVPLCARRPVQVKTADALRRTVPTESSRSRARLGPSAPTGRGTGQQRFRGR